MQFTFERKSSTQVEFLKKLPSEARLAESLGFRPEKILVVYDKKLRRIDSAAKWLKEFKYVYAVDGGEGVKDVSAFSGRLRNIFRLVTPFSAHSFAIVSLGGGSVGDFAGFLASVLKRGVPLIHIPSTLLAAMDSAHGGKTALNVGDIKNQVGSFYPARSIMLVRGLFEGLPSLQLQSAGGELAKMALLSGGELFENFQNKFELNLDSLWEILPAVIQAKYQIVERDPFEQTGERQILNLGHSLGHALESHCGLAHGVAVAEGLIFAIEWSAHRGYFKGSTQQALIELLVQKLELLRPNEFVKRYRSLSRSKISRYVLEDKKLKDARHLNFIFLERIGEPIRKTVPIESFLVETQRQGWASS